MKLSKTWLVGLLGYLAFFVKQAFPQVEIPDTLLDQVADVVLLLAGIIPMIVNMTKPKTVKVKEQKHPFDQQYASLPFDESKTS